MAWIGTARFLTRALTAIAFLASPALAQKAASPYTVANVKSEAEAADSVEAKKVATQAAKTRAFRQLVTRLVDFRAGSRIPDLPANEIERLVSEIQVKGEGASGTGYVATFAVTFSERAVNALFSRYGVIPILDRGPEILIVPVLIQDGNAVISDRNPWRAALASLDLTHALVPAKVAPVRQDLTAAIANSYAANASAGVEALKTQYRTAQLVLAVANVSSGNNVLTLNLAGNDATGLFSVQRKVNLEESSSEPLMQTAAQLAFDSLQERWKLTRDTFPQAGTESGGQSAAGTEGGTPDGAPASAGYMSGEMSSIEITAEFSGLKEWQAIRGRLQNLPGVQNWTLKSVNPRNAAISFDFPGGAARLTAMAAAQGLSVESGPDGLTVKTR
jgi:hypothetical protein